MSPPRPAYVESIDEDSGRTVKGSRRSAKEKSKEKKQRSDKSKRSPQVNYLPAPPPPLKERAVREKNIQVVTEREVKHERRNSTSSTSPLSPRKHQRPPLAHENSHQADKKTKDDPSHFGRVQSVPRPALPVLSQSMQNTLVHPQPARPRAATSNSYPRPLSFHATQNGGPPLSNSAWANYQPTPTYTYSSSPNYSQTPQYPQYSAPTPPPGSDYFGAQPLSLPERPVSTRPLSSRFEAPARTASGFGMRDPLAHEFNPSYDTGYHDDGYASSNNGAVVKRISIREPSRPKRMSRDYHDSQTYHDSQDYHEPQTYHDSQSYHDSQTMPPPPQPRPILRRPWTEQATNGEYPPHDSYREDRDERSEERSMIRDPSRPRRASTRRRKSMVTYELPDPHDHDEDHEPVRAPRTRRSDSLRQPKHAYDDMVTDLAEMNIETANNSRRRRSSVYGTSTTHSEPKASTKQSGYEDKIRQAANYQEDVAGPNIPLTAEVLKKQEKQRRKAGSSQSTKSSHSRDESDYKKSVTTRTTRSGSGDNDENLTIKLKGTTRLIVGGAQIECDGGEIEIKRQGSMRNGSERSISEYGGPTRGQQQIDDRRSRVHHQIEDRKSRVNQQIEDRRSRVEPIDDRQSRVNQQIEDRRSRVEPIDDRQSRGDQQIEDRRSRPDHEDRRNRRNRVDHEERVDYADRHYEDRHYEDRHYEDRHYEDRRSRFDHDDRQSRHDHPMSQPRQRESSQHSYTRSLKYNGDNYF
ncbi:hypothetical protein HYALB_00006424 [Hymenoscyphus albidus]|uniref:Uncharacterized protein n=1 Tax=Hymenoscyphus albidus TaxID=595503 RepID=A0A9N9LGB9_9HELO|nr:hypothetical protein HYALB_00006424 [Hymenoscyphus albidus]